MKEVSSVLFLVFACFISSGSEAKNKTLIFSTFELGLFNEVNEKIFTEIYRRLGIDIVIKKYPAARAISLANSGVTDGELSRKALVAKLYPDLLMVPTAYDSSETVMFTKKTDFSIARLNDLNPYKIGLLRGYKIAERLTQNFSVEPIATPEQLFYFLDKGRADVVLYSREAGLAYIRALGLEHIRVVEPAVESEPVYHFLHKKHADLVPKVDAAIREAVKEGLPEKITRQVFADLKINAP